MKKKDVSMGQDGFTVLETTLFLAISAALVTVAIIGTGGMIQSIRFSDSVRSTHAHIQSQYDEILNGVNPRTAAAICEGGSGEETEPGASNCLLLGKLVNIDIGTGSLQTHYVVSTLVPDLADPEFAELSDQELIAAVDPLVVKTAGSVEEYTVPWGAEVFNSRRSDGQAANTYALLRSPRSSRLVSYTFNMDRSTLNGASNVLLTTQLVAANVQKPTNFCIERAQAGPFDFPAAITVADGEGQSAISVKFDIPQDQIEAKCEGTEGMALAYNGEAGVGGDDEESDEPVYFDTPWGRTYFS